jgi:hypothetical protein
MDILMYLTASGASFWKRQRGTWVAASPTEGHSLGVVTNLPEETIIELPLPKLSATDRARFVARQLANRFPGSDFALAPGPMRARGSTFSRQALVAIDPSERLQTAVAESGAKLASVHCSSLLLAKQAARAMRGPNGIAAAVTEAGLRVVAIVDGAAVLTRLVQAARSADEQAREILRTVRHLENTRLVERNGSSLEVLLLGTHPDTATLLSQDRLQPLALSRELRSWSETEPFAWFDGARRLPQLQMAAAKRRTVHLERVWRRNAWVASACAAMLLPVLAACGWYQGYSAKGSQASFDTRLSQVRSEIAELEARLAAEPLSANTLREMQQQYDQHVGQHQDMWPGLERLSRVLEARPDLRLTRLKWRRLSEGETACAEAGNRVAVGTAVGHTPGSTTLSTAAAAMSAGMMNGTDPAATAAADAQPKSRAELLFRTRSSASDLQTQVDDASALAQGFSRWEGAQVLLSPLSALRQSELTGGASQKEDASLDSWCLAIEVKGRGAAGPSVPGSFRQNGNGP